MSLSKVNVQRNKGGHVSRPSLADEAWELYRLAQAYGDEATMRIAMRDIEIARELERDPAEEIVTPLPEDKQPALARSTACGKWRTGGEVQASPAISRRPMTYGWTPASQRGAA